MTRQDSHDDPQLLHMEAESRASEHPRVTIRAINGIKAASKQHRSWITVEGGLPNSS
jgi:hypothetical protein